MLVLLVVLVEREKGLRNSLFALLRLYLLSVSSFVRDNDNA